MEKVEKNSNKAKHEKKPEKNKTSFDMNNIFSSIKSFLKKHVREIIELIVLLIIIIALRKIFYSYNINLTWDSSEYIGLASYIGTDEMQDKWISHRGIGFPWLIKKSQEMGENKVDGMLKLMYTFYVFMIVGLFLIYKKLSNAGILKNIILALAFVRFC